MQSISFNPAVKRVNQFQALVYPRFGELSGLSDPDLRTEAQCNANLVTGTVAQKYKMNEDIVTYIRWKLFLGGRVNLEKRVSYYVEVTLPQSDARQRGINEKQVFTVPRNVYQSVVAGTPVFLKVKTTPKWGPLNMFGGQTTVSLVNEIYA